MPKNITTKDAVELCLSAYYLQEGSRANKQVIRKMGKLLKQLDKDSQLEVKIQHTRYLKLLFRRLFCKHSFRHVATLSGRHIETDTTVVLEYGLECVECGKWIIVRLDTDCQIKSREEV